MTKLLRNMMIATLYLSLAYVAGDYADKKMKENTDMTMTERYYVCAAIGAVMGFFMKRAMKGGE